MRLMGFSLSSHVFVRFISQRDLHEFIQDKLCAVRVLHFRHSRLDQRAKTKQNCMTCRKPTDAVLKPWADRKICMERHGNTFHGVSIAISRYGRTRRVLPRRGSRLVGVPGDVICQTPSPRGSARTHLISGTPRSIDPGGRLGDYKGH